MTSAQYTIYNIPNYKITKAKFKDHAFTGNIEQVCSELSKSCGYHFRIIPGTKYIYFADIDEFLGDIGLLKNTLFALIFEKYEIILTDDDFKYTKNKSKPGSYHISIPKINCSLATLSDIQVMLTTKYPSLYLKNGKKLIDPSIYSEHWFRCPNQLKESIPNTEHIIVHGKLEDFVVEYIPEYSVYINTIESIPVAIVNQISKSNTSSIIPSSIKPSSISNFTGNEKNKYIFELLDCISPNRASNYDDWIDFAYIFKNTFEINGLTYFDYFSRKCPAKYNESNVTAVYTELQLKKDIKHKTIKSLYFYALTDNKTKAMSIIQNQELFNIMELNDNNMCEYLYDLAHDKFIWINNEFYSLSNNNYWVKDNILFRQYLSYDLYEILKNNSTSLKYHKILTQLLLNKTGKDAIFATSKEFFTNNKIKMDTHIGYLPFNNAIYDLKNKFWISHKSDLYISSVIGYDWREPSQTELDKMNEIISQIQPNPEHRRCMLQILASGLDGYNLDKFIIFTGEGRNGKSLLNDMLIYILDCFAYKGRANSLTNIKDGSNPELAHISNKRLVVFREPSQNLPIQNSIIKDLTGGSDINARMNFSNDTKIKLNATIILETNVLPTLAEQATFADVERIIVIDFPSKFVDEIHTPLQPNTYIKNQDYKTEAFQDIHKFSFLKILMDHYVGTNFNIPNEIKKASMHYIKKSFKLLEWVEENIEFNCINSFISLASEFKASINIDPFFSKNKKNITDDIIDCIVKNINPTCYVERKKINNKDYRHVIINAKFKTDTYSRLNIYDGVS